MDGGTGLILLRVFRHSSKNIIQPALFIYLHRYVILVTDKFVLLRKTCNFVMNFLVCLTFVSFPYTVSYCIAIFREELK